MRNHRKLLTIKKTKKKMEILKMMTDSGMSITDVIDHLPKIQKGVELLKEKMHLIKEYEKTLNLKETERVVYSVIPIVTESHKEIIIAGLVIDKNKDGETVVTREAFKMNGLERLNEIMALIPSI